MKKQNKKKGSCLKTIVGTIVSLFLIIIIVGVVTDSKKDTDTKSTSVSTPSAVSTVSSDMEPAPAKDDTPTEYKSALSKAKSYSDVMYMSKQGIYDQLTSEYGEKFSAEAGQYAVDNLEADYKANALEKAKDYQSTMDMSPEAIRDQLVSEHGEKFTQEEADYAVSNLQ